MVEEITELIKTELIKTKLIKTKLIKILTEKKILTEEEEKEKFKNLVEEITELINILTKVEEQVDNTISELNDKISELKNVVEFIHYKKFDKSMNKGKFLENINKALLYIDKSKKSIDSIKKINHRYNFDTYYDFKGFLNNKIKENRYHYILTFDIEKKKLEKKKLINFINDLKNSSNTILTENIPKFQNVFVSNSLKISKKKTTIMKVRTVSFENLIRCYFKKGKFINPLLSHNNNNSMISLDFIDKDDSLNEPLITFCNRFDIEFKRMEII